MKRVCSLILVFLLFNVCFLTPVFAAKTATLTITAPTSCAPGETITVYIGLKRNSNIAAADFRVSYDTAVFEFVNYENGELCDNRLAVGNCKDGKVLFSTVGTEPIMDAGTLFTVQFKVDSKAKGTHEFKFYTVSCCDYDGNDIETNVAIGKTKIVSKSVSQQSPVSSTPVQKPSEVSSAPSFSQASSSKVTTSSQRSAASKDASSKQSAFKVPVSSVSSVSSNGTSVSESPYEIGTDSLISSVSVVSAPTYDREASAFPISSEEDSDAKSGRMIWLFVLIGIALIIIPFVVFMIVFFCIKSKSTKNQ